jgi:hypothetical protein
MDEHKMVKGRGHWQIRLTYCNRLLKDEDTINDCNMRNEATIAWVGLDMIIARHIW